MAERSQEKAKISAVCCYRLRPRVLFRVGCRLGVAGWVVVAGWLAVARRKRVGGGWWVVVVEGCVDGRARDQCLHEFCLPEFMYTS
jgi:hypothetical protein